MRLEEHWFHKKAFGRVLNFIGITKNKHGNTLSKMYLEPYEYMITYETNVLLIKLILYLRYECYENAQEHGPWPDARVAVGPLGEVEHAVDGRVGGVVDVVGQLAQDVRHVVVCLF